MERNKYLQPVNPQKYAPFLSDFGKKVLYELMKQWDKAQKPKPQNTYYRPSSQNKKIINSNGDIMRDTPATNIISSSPITLSALEEEEERSALHLNVKDVNELKVPTTEELTKTLPIEADIDNHEFVYPTIDCSNIIQQLHETNDDEHDQTIKKARARENINRTDKPYVNWDMFDSEIFDDITNNIFNEENNIIPPDNTNIYKAGLNCKNNEKRSGKRQNKNNVCPKVAKKPRKVTNNSNESAKKVIKTKNDVTKPSFRKEKYTKTIKNWLNDFESYNPINGETSPECFNNINHDEDLTLDIENKELNQSTTAKNDKAKITIDKSLKEVKKVVQSRLANKDGVMKFCKPKNEIAKSKDTEIENIKVNSRLPKDKKDKGAKNFIPPIKSQIPVKTITYEIITVDVRNFDELKELNNVDEITAVLIFSNGFCQLNSHFTDDECSIDGILLGAGDMFYYIKSSDQKIKEALTGLLVNNKVVISYEARLILIYLTTHFHMEIYSINMYDAKIGVSLLDPDNSPENFSDVQKLLSFTPTYTIATECTLQKAAWYMTLLKECWTKLQTLLVEKQLWQVFVDVEMNLLPIIAEMEQLGVSIDMPKLKSMEEVLQTRMKLVEQQCYKAAGKVFQINSTVQVRAILYDELQLDTKCNVRIRETISGGVKSTSETMLRSLMSVHPLPKLILEYRHLHKAYATFLTGIAQHVKDGVVKPTWEQTAAATGRIASNNPNLQAIPKTPFSLVMFPDDNETDIQYVNFRSVYVPREGYTLLAADFKHVECRVFAHAAADTGLLRALTHSDDLFRVLAAQWLNKSEECVSSEERERTKRLVYASLYGAGTRKLMEILDLTYEQALQVAASFNRTFPSLKWFGRQVVSQCVQAGGRLSTLRGRVRHFTNITSEDFNLRSHAERQAVNFIIQGSAADLCKTAMISTAGALRGRRGRRGAARLVLQIHDELVWELPRTHLHTAAGIIKQVMEGCGQQCGMSMTLPVAITVGKNWGEMEDYTFVSQ